MARFQGGELDFFDDYETANAQSTEEIGTLPDPSQWWFGGEPATPKLGEGWRTYIGTILSEQEREETEAKEERERTPPSIVRRPAYLSEDLGDIDAAEGFDYYDADETDEASFLERTTQRGGAAEALNHRWSPPFGRSRGQRYERETKLCILDEVACGTRQWAVCGEGRSMAAPRAAEARAAHKGKRLDQICSVGVVFIDGSWITVEALKGDLATTVLGTALAALGVGHEHIASFGLYEVADVAALSPRAPPSPATSPPTVQRRQLGRRIAPATLAVTLAEGISRGAFEVAVAVRLFTAPLGEAARRGFERDADASERALGRLVHAQAVAWVMSGSARFPERLHPGGVVARGGQTLTTGQELAVRLGALRLWARSVDVAAEARNSMASQPFTPSSPPPPPPAPPPQHLGAGASSPPSQQQKKSGAASPPSSPPRARRRPAGSQAALSDKLLNKLSRESLPSVGARLMAQWGVRAFVPDDVVRRSTLRSHEWAERVLNEFTALLTASFEEARHDAARRNASSSSFSSSSGGLPHPVADDVGVVTTMDSFFGLFGGPPSSPPAPGDEAPTTTFLSTPRSPLRSIMSSGHLKLTGTQLPEAAYLDLASQLPLYGATLFACRKATREPILNVPRQRATPLDETPPTLRRGTSEKVAHVLAISSEGATILGAADDDEAHDASETAAAATAAASSSSNSAVLEVPIVRVRRWRRLEDGAGVYFESETPYHSWPEVARTRRTMDYVARQATRDAIADRAAAVAARPPVAKNEAPTTTVHHHHINTRRPPEATKKMPPEVLNGRDSAPMQLMAFALEFVAEAAGARETTVAEAAEALLLLDDYSLFDLAHSRPRCEYESRRPDQITVRPPPPPGGSPLKRPIKGGATGTRRQQQQSSSKSSSPPPTATRSRSTGPADADAAGHRRSTSESSAGSENDGSTASNSTRASSSSWVDHAAAQQQSALAVPKSPLTESDAFDALVGAVVRPPRFIYDVRLLGPSSFAFGGLRFVRRDLVLKNRDGLRLQCSHWTLAETPLDRRPAVVFMHANSASRVQACNYLSVVLSLGCSLFAFDCSGSGLSDGNQVSLGWREAHDLVDAVNYLKSPACADPASSVAVWGHSMGAAAIVYYHALADAPPIDACVLDSPYSDFSELASHLVREHSLKFAGALGKYVSSLGVSQLALKMALDYVDKEVERVGAFSPVRDLVPTAHAAKCAPPALFMRARGDKIVTLAHIEAVANAYAGPRKLALVDGSHSSPRNGAARRFIALFLAKNIRLPSPSLQPDPRARDRYIEAVPWQRVRNSLPATTSKTNAAAASASSSSSLTGASPSKKRPSTAAAPSAS